MVFTTVFFLQLLLVTGDNRLSGCGRVLQHCVKKHLQQICSQKYNFFGKEKLPVHQIIGSKFLNNYCQQNKRESA